MSADWRDLIKLIKESQSRFQQKTFEIPPGDHGEAMRRHGISEGYDMVEAIVTTFFTEKDDDADGDRDKEDNPQDED